MRNLNVTPNENEKTFTLEFMYEDGSNIIYKTTEMSEEEFEEAELNTENDWKAFLRNGSYRQVK